jgi:hypothetical protein
MSPLVDVKRFACRSRERISHREEGEAGQALVEFALVTLFVILPLTFAIIDGSILFYKWVALNNGAREGARAGAIYQDNTPSDGSQAMMQGIDLGRRDVITQTVGALIGPLVSIDWDQPQDWEISYPDGDPCTVASNPNICEPCDIYDVYRGGVCRGGEYHSGAHRVTVSITHTHQSLVGLVIGLGEIDLTATATMRIEPGGPAPTPTISP